MPIFPKLFKRRRTTSVVENSAQVPAPSSSGYPQVADSDRSLPVPGPILHRSASEPLSQLIPKNGVYGNSYAPNPPPVIAMPVPMNGIPLAPAITPDAKLLPPTPTPTQQSPVAKEAAVGMDDMWRGIENRGAGAHVANAERMLNELTDETTFAVNIETSSDGVVGFVKDVIANDEVQAIGKTILEGVPAIMSALETLSEIHPFLKAAYLPFKLIYHQETERRENDQKRNKLFDNIKDVMLVLVELKGFPKDDTRKTPDQKPVLGRLAQICKDMKKDIEECYNVLNAQEKRSVAIKFLKATSWNRELAVYGSRFTTRREELQFALNMRTAVTAEEINQNMNKMMEMFATMMSPQERDVGRWIQQNGGEKAVLGDDKKCAAMIKYESTIVTTGPATRAEKGKAGVEEGAKKAEAKAIATLRKEYREGIQAVIQENLESYSKRFEMGLDDLGRDLGNKIQHQGDRLIKYLKGGPRSRIKDKMVYHVWKDQGWKGSAKTRPLVLAIRDYFVERVEHSKLAPPPKDAVTKRPTSKVPNPAGEENDDDGEDDPEADISAPLPDHWMTAYLQVKRLRYLQQAFDPDSSGFTTISEINAFTYARPTDWSFPRWVAYWTIGWQISATKYCIEIEKLFAQMFVLKHKIGITMPGNTRYINGYIDDTWQYVTALTSAIERYDSAPPWLEEKFVDYDNAQEKLLKERLEKIQYDIDALETVSLILRHERIEEAVFPLLALLMRRHVAKMHLALKQEFDSNEVGDDADTITRVVYAVWMRFLNLKERFQHQKISDSKLTFEWLSCGLFKNYHDWDNWFLPQHFMNSDMTAWSAYDTLEEPDPSELVGILAYTNGKPDIKPEVSTDTTPPSSPTAETPPPEHTENADHPSSPVSTADLLAANKLSLASPNSVVAPPTPSEMSITGIWYGWYWTETRNPFLSMNKMELQCGKRSPDTETEVAITGSGMSVGTWAFTVTGTMNAEDQPEGSLAINFERYYPDGTSITHTGTYFPDREVISGTFLRSGASGNFLFKKVPVSSVLCLRPLVPKLDTKQLWSFACNAILDRIRRENMGPSYLYKRLTDAHRLVVFTYKENMHLLKDDDLPVYSDIQKSFTYEENVELFKLCLWYARAGDLQLGFPCNSCSNPITRCRVVCIGCVSTRTDPGWHTVDFCGKLDCVASENIPQRTDVTHLSSHLMLKTRDFFHLKDYYTTKQRAEWSLTYIRNSYKDPEEDRSLTVPLPRSPTSPAADIPPLPVLHGELQSAAATTLPEDKALAAPTINQEPTTQSMLPPLDTSAAQASPALPETEATVNEQSTTQPVLSPLDTTMAPSDPASSHLLSALTTPHEEMVDQQFRCTICHERVVAPCWYCLDCDGAFVCDLCEKMIDDLEPWDLIKRYRAEIARGDDSSVHNVYHILILVVPAKMWQEAAKPPGGGDSAESSAAKSPSVTLQSPMEQLEVVEKRIQAFVEERFAAVDKRLEEVESRLESRLTSGLGNIERLLNMLAAQRG